MPNNGLLQPKTKQRLKFVSANYGSMSRKEMAKALKCGVEHVDYIISAYIKPGRTEPQAAKEDIIISPEAKRFLFNLLLLDKAVKRYKVDATIPDVVSGLIARTHEKSQLMTGRTKGHDKFRNTKRQRKHYDIRRSQGLCVKCLNKINTARSTWYCTEHLEQAKARQQMINERLKAQEA